MGVLLCLCDHGAHYGSVRVSAGVHTRSIRAMGWLQLVGSIRL